MTQTAALQEASAARAANQVGAARMGDSNDCLPRETDEMEEGIGARRRGEQEIPTRDGVLR
jgi:hypothetical protein